MRLRIRKAQLSDYEALLPLFDQIDSSHREALAEIFVKPGGRPRQRDYFQDLPQQPEVGFLVAEAGD